MNRAQIEQATGRELDAMIAEHLFGWRWMELSRPSWTHPVVGLYPSTDSDLMNPGDWRDVTDEPIKAVRARDWSRNVPAYSTTGDKMLLVLEKMNELRYIDILGRTGGELMPIVAKFFAPLLDDAPKFTFAECFTAASNNRPEAVCRAALLALLTQKGNQR